MYIFHRVVLSLIFILIAACSGGGGSGPTPIVPPAPVGNQPPVISVSISDTTPNEGQSFTLDASSSSDPNDDALSFSWTQSSGPVFEISDASAPSQTFSIPELTESSDVTFEVEVSDGELTTTRSFTVTLTNIDQFPKFAAQFAEVKTLIANGKVRDIIAVPAREIAGVSAVGERRDVWFVATSSDDDSTRLQEFYFSAADEVEANPQLPPLPGYDADAKFFFARGHSAFIVVEESANRISGVASNLFGPGEIYQQVYSFDVDTPCGVTSRYDIGEEIVDGYVARRNSGITRFSFELFPYPAVNYASLIVRSVMDNDVSLCAATQIVAPFDNTPIPGESFFELENGLMAIDEPTQSLYFFGRSGFGDPQVVPLQTETRVPLEIKSVAALTGSALIIAASDGNHEGTHRLIFAGIDVADNITQVTKSWDVGVPSDIVIGNIDDDPLSATDVTVISSTSSEAIVFSLSDTAYLLTATNGSQFYARNPYLPVGDPTFLEVGLGAVNGLADTLTSMENGVTGLFVTYSDSDEIRFFSHRCDPNTPAVPIRCYSSTPPDPLPPGSPPQ